MTPRHRHFIALPLVAAVLAVLVGFGGLGSMASASATIMGTVAGADDIIGVPGDTLFTVEEIPAAGSLSDGGRAHVAQGRLWLDDGAMTVSSPSLVIVRAMDMEFSAFDGAFLLVRGSRSVTVMALSAPVLIRNGAYRFVLPTGYHIAVAAEELPRMQDLQDVAARLPVLARILPETYASELAKASKFPLPPLPAFASSDEGGWPAFLLLPKSVDRVQAGEQLAAFLRLRGAIESGDIAASREALSHPLVVASLANAPDPQTLRTLIVLAQDMPSIERELVQYVRDPDLWLLLSLHPRFSLAAWETGGPMSAPLSTRTQRFLQFPSSDVAEAHSAQAIKQWQKQLGAYLQTADAPEFLSMLLSSLTGYKAFTAEHDLPERLLRYAHALHALSADYADAFSPEHHALLQEWLMEEELPEYRDAEPLAIPAEGIPQVSVPAPVAEKPVREPVTGAEARTQEAEAKTMLQDAGGLFAVTTKMHAEVRGHVDVEGIVFASSAGDTLFDFTLDLAGKRVTDIRHDGEMLPYPMSLEAFAAWAKGR